MKINLKERTKFIHTPKFLVSSFFILLCLTVFFAIASSGKGAQIVSIERQINTLEEENREFESIVVAQNSLKKVAESAPQIGLTPGAKMLYWNQDLSVAKLP